MSILHVANDPREDQWVLRAGVPIGALPHVHTTYQQVTFLGQDGARNYEIPSRRNGGPGAQGNFATLGPFCARYLVVLVGRRTRSGWPGQAWQVLAAGKSHKDHIQPRKFVGNPLALSLALLSRGPIMRDIRSFCIPGRDCRKGMACEIPTPCNACCRVVIQYLLWL